MIIIQQTFKNLDNFTKLYMIYVYEGIIFIQGCGWKNVSRRRISHGSEFSARFPLGLIVIDLYTQYTQLHPPPSTNLCTVYVHPSFILYTFFIFKSYYVHHFI